MTKAKKTTEKSSNDFDSELAALLSGDRPVVVGLRTCNSDRTSKNGFAWPERGWAVAPDWNTRPECGGGLHFLKNGVGEPSNLNWSGDALWQAVIAYADETVDIGADKSKASRLFVALCGSRVDATRWVCEWTGWRYAVHGCVSTAGNEGTATAGNEGTATAGDYGTATAGDEGTATAGDYGTATAGNEGTATAGYRGTATAGYRGTATAGYRGTATAGYRGIIVIKEWDAVAGRYRLVVGYVGENGIEPNKPYIVRDGKLVPADKE